MDLLFDLIVLACVLFFAYLGWEKGMWTAGVAALELLACLSLAVLLHEPIANFLTPWMWSLVSSELSQTWAILITFGLLAWVPFAVLRYRCHKEEKVNLDFVDIDPLSDRIGGAIAGGVGGVLFVGGILVTVSMTPFLAPMKPSGDRLMFDVGKVVLQTCGHFVIERPEGYEGPPLPIFGGPVSTKLDKRAILTCEPWRDVNDDTEFSEETDRYRDVDASGGYTKDLYAADVDGTGRRRIGLIDKYVTGCWDTLLLAQTRKRTDVAKPDPKGRKGRKGVGDDPEDKPIESDF